MSNLSTLPIPGIDSEAPLVPAARRAPEMVYESPLATVYHGRSEDLLPLLGTETVDLIVTDPPYGVAWQSNRRAEKFDQLANDGASDRDTIARIMQECVRVVRQHRHLYVFGPTDVLEGLKVGACVPLVWDKGTLGSGDVTAAWGPSHEPITFTVSKHRHAGDTGKMTVPARLRKGSVLSYTRPTGRNVRHPSEKPVPLMRELIESSSRQGETILDPFAGSGSTAVAAILTGRRIVTVESEEKYAAMTVERIKAAEALVGRINDV
jgi:site-specific DNA-methyltransferase (adenine-specific)